MSNITKAQASRCLALADP